MHAATLYLTHGEASDPEIYSKLDGEPPAVDAEATQYLDGNRCYYGEAADLIEVEHESVEVAATDGGDEDQQSLDDLDTVNDPSGGGA